MDWGCVVAGLDEPWLVLARDARVHEANPAALRVLGYAEAELRGLALARLLTPETLVGVVGCFEQALGGQAAGAHEATLVSAAGESKPVTISALACPIGTEAGVCLVARERAASPRREVLAATVFEHSREGIVITDGAGDILAVNPAFTAITGYGEEEVLGRNPRLLQSGRQEPDFYAAMWAAINEAGHWQGEIWNRRKDGAVYPEWLTISAVRNAVGEVVNLLALFSDISAIKASQDRLDHLAHHDPLTDLPNRLLFRARLQQALTRAARDRSRVAVLYVDLDEFKPVNDTHGHATGDAVLIEVARRLRSCLRGEDTVARLGGDEFALVLEALRDAGNAERIAALIERKLAEPYVLGDLVLGLRASVGISVAPDDGCEEAELMRKADAAMYRHKAARRADRRRLGGPGQGLAIRA